MSLLKSVFFFLLSGETSVGDKLEEPSDACAAHTSIAHFQSRLEDGSWVQQGCHQKQLET